MKLSCVIIICDKDFRNLENLLNDIEQQVQMEHEVIVWDNRDRCKVLPLNLHGAKLTGCGQNVFQFEAKRQAVKLCSGDYLWFIDGDDRIKGDKITADIFAEQMDLYCFQANLTVTEGATLLEYEQDEVITNNVFTLDTYYKIGVPLWAKFIKADVFRTICSKIKRPERIHISEDCLWSILCLYHSKSVKLLKKYFYEYHRETSDSTNPHYANIEPLLRWSTGHFEMLHLMDEIIPKEAQLKAWIRSEDIYRNNLIDMIGKWFNCDTEIRPQFMQKVILKYYSRDFILWTLSCWVNKYKPVEMLSFYEGLDKATGNSKIKECVW